MNRGPLISIIVPVYRVEECLPRCLDSICRQEAEALRYEVIVVDDGSPDRSPEIAARYAARHETIRLFSQPNRGVSAARNRGIDEARGDYLCFVDADDALEPDALAELARRLEAQRPEILFMRGCVVQGDSILEPYPFAGLQDDRQYSGRELFGRGYIRGSVCGAAFRREFLKQSNLRFIPGVRNGEDSLFCAMCFVQAADIRFAPFVFYRVFRRAESASAAWDFSRLEALLTVNLPAIDALLASPSLADASRAILEFQRYLVFSTLFTQLFARGRRRLRDYRKLRHKIKAANRYRLHWKAFPIRRLKAALLNFSSGLYAVSVFFNGLRRRRT